MTKDFEFKDPDMQKFITTNKTAIAGMVGVPEEEIVCKGFRVFFVHEPSGTMCSQGMFVDQFDPDTYGEDDE